MRKIFVILFNSSASSPQAREYNSWFQSFAWENMEGLAGVFECSPETLSNCPVTMQEAGLSFFSKLPAVAFFEKQGNNLFFLENAKAPFDKRYVEARVRALSQEEPIQGGGGGREGGSADSPGLPIGIFPGGNWARWWPLILLGGYLLYQETKGA